MLWSGGAVLLAQVQTQPYLGGAIGSDQFGLYSPCRCNMLYTEVHSGVRIGSRIRAGGLFGLTDLTLENMPYLGAELGLGILPFKNENASRRRLELTGSFAALLLKNRQEGEQSVRNNGYLRTVNLVWRPWAAKPAGAGFHLGLGYVALYEHQRVNSAEGFQSESRETNTGWRLRLGYSL